MNTSNNNQLSYHILFLSRLAFLTIRRNVICCNFIGTLNTDENDLFKISGIYLILSLFCNCEIRSPVFVKTNPYSCLQNNNWTLFTFIINTYMYLWLQEYSRYSQFFLSNGLHISQFFSILGYYLDFPNYSLDFFGRRTLIPKEIKKKNKENINTNKITTILYKIITVLLILIHCHFEYLCERKRTNLKLKPVTMFLKIPKNCPIEPQLSFLMKNYGICMACESESVDQGRSYSTMNINISNCFFSRSSAYSGNGGVINVNGGSYSMNLNYSMFYNCVCTSWGGAIYFYSLNSYLRMICANRCIASSKSHFAYLIASQVNQVVYLSVSNCSHTTSGYYSIIVYTGNQRFDNTNSSMNNAHTYSSIFIRIPSSFTSSHCSFSNNKAYSSICIYFLSSSGAISMSYANIVHNNSPSSYGVIYILGSVSPKMMYCIFQNNQDYLFCVAQGSLEISHSFIDHSSESFSTSIAISIATNNSMTNMITYPIQFYNSFHCIADIPLLEQEQMITLDQTYMKLFSFAYPIEILMIL